MRQPNTPAHLAHRLPTLVLVFLLGSILLAACNVPFNAERRYLSMIFTHASSTLELIGALQQQLANPQFGSQPWESQVNANIVALRIQINDARRLDPPNRFVPLHRSYLAIMDTLDSFANSLSLAMTNRDLVQIQQLLQQLNQIRQSLDTIFAQFRQQIEQFSTEPARP